MATPDKRDLFPWMNSVRETLAAYPRDQRYLIGVSGGLDSRVLLELLQQFGFSRLAACYLKHDLHGAATPPGAEFLRGPSKHRTHSSFCKTISTLAKKKLH